jgi:hypothetical protein
MAELRRAAEGRNRPRSRLGLLIVVTLWLAVAGLLGWALWRD